ncbi:MAG: type II toxin-antitoxin system RelE/ParE family toxin [Methylococcus sp.]|nr:type II toxin-antitoxin system RelE/ParE family toxin [Methylococcus sp.]
MKCLFSAMPEHDLEEIADHIAQDNPRRAPSYLREIRARCGDILDLPEAVSLRQEFGDGIRMVPMDLLYRQ